MGFYFQDDFWETVKELPQKEQDKAIASLVRYFFTGEEPEFNGVAKMPFIAFRDRIDLSKKQSANARKPRKPKNEPNDSQTVAKQEPEVSQTVDVLNKREKENKKKKIPPKGGIKEKEPVARFSPPSPEEVKAYSQSLGKPIDGNRFCDFYASKGWRVGSTPMKDWRAAVRTWIQRDEPKGGAYANVIEFVGGVPF